MTLSRKLCVASGAAAGLGSAVWLGVSGSLVVHVVLVPATVVVAMLIAAAGVLLVEDWRADLESRRAWGRARAVGC
jgi:galactitol-specific phosphotransferase system IIC component